MNVVSRDIDRFWEIWPDIVDADVETSAAIIESDYLTGGSPGLQDFLEKRIESARQLAGTIAARPRYYASLKQVYDHVPDQVAAIDDACRRLCDLLPNAQQTDAYLLMGRMNSGGTVSDRGVLVGFDMFGRNESTPWEELGAWDRSVLYSVEQLPELILHEFAHCNQTSATPATLLAKAINEGAADFVVALLLGPIKADRYEYGRMNEDDLWRRFQTEMRADDTSKWLYEGDSAKDRPADLGYFLGHQICASYYVRQSSPDKAVRDILSIEDHERFLTESGYEGVDPGPVSSPS